MVLHPASCCTLKSAAISLQRNYVPPKKSEVLEDGGMEEEETEDEDEDEEEDSSSPSSSDSSSDSDEEDR